MFSIQTVRDAVETGRELYVETSFYSTKIAVARAHSSTLALKVAEGALESLVTLRDTIESKPPLSDRLSGLLDKAHDTVKARGVLANTDPSLRKYDSDVRGSLVDAVTYLLVAIDDHGREGSSVPNTPVATPGEA